jgi:hypothetical protein
MLFLPEPALADSGFADAPNQPLVVGEHHEPGVYAEQEAYGTPPPLQPSSLRVSVGPALRVAEPATDGGLYVALDLGARAAGVRASGTFVRAGSEHGVSQYAVELWIDFGVGRELHPILAAGAGVARIEGTNASGDERTATLGVGILRGTLEYVLPVAGVDARVGVDAIGSVPATPGGDAADARPWLLGVGHVGVGF